MPAPASPAPEKKVLLSRTTRRRCGHEVRATWLGLDAKVIKVVDRSPRGERLEDRKSSAISSAFLFSKGPPTRPLQTPWGEHVRRQPGPFLKAKEISTLRVSGNSKSQSQSSAKSSGMPPPPHRCFKLSSSLGKATLAQEP